MSLNKHLDEDQPTNDYSEHVIALNICRHVIVDCMLYVVSSYQHIFMPCPELPNDILLGTS